MAKGDSARGVIPGANNYQMPTHAWQDVMGPIGQQPIDPRNMNVARSLGWGMGNMGGGMGRMGQQNPYQMGIGAGLNNQPMQGLFGNAGNQMPQANMLPTSNQSIQDLLYPTRSSDPMMGGISRIGSGIGGLFF